MHNHRVGVTISPDGQVRLEVEGMKGEGCLDLTRALEELLGNDIEDRQMKDEAYEEVAEHEREDLWG